jgi:hypothetical protein
LGDFAQAVEWQQTAVQAAQDEATRKAGLERLERYKQGKPHRQVASQTTDEAKD